jgi:hypothetical protein
MVRFVLEISNLWTKLFIALMIISMFSVIYITVPHDEFHKIEHYNGINKDINYLDIIQYSFMSQVGIQNSVLYPKTIRTRVLTILQLFFGYMVLLM